MNLEEQTAKEFQAKFSSLEDAKLCATYLIKHCVTEDIEFWIRVAQELMETELDDDYF